jgi:hydroxypyruvate isomerase
VTRFIVAGGETSGIVTTSLGVEGFHIGPQIAPGVPWVRSLDEHGLTQALFNVYAGDWDAGERGLAALPGRDDEFRASITQALEYAEALDCPKLHLMSGRGVDVNDSDIRAHYVENVRWAAEQAAAAGRLLVLEPLNAYDNPGYYVPSVARAVELIDEIDRDNVRLQFDFYHAQLTDGDITNLLARVADRIGHVQLASVPARNEPDRGELCYPFVLEALDRTGYDGWVGCEYRPAAGTTEGLGWLDAYENWQGER